MLGEIIFESKGKIIGQRVKSVEDEIPKLEITATGSGTVIRNFKLNETWTYWTIRKQDGSFCGGG
jgi:translation initiation factor 2 beta subunit (eIF-2beta)/eIF-5